MSSNVMKIVGKLTVASATINVMTDSLNQHIEYIEAALKALNLGVGVLFQSDKGSLVLGYGRIKSTWRLYVEVEDPTGKSFSKIKIPLVDAPRGHRLQVIDLIPELLEALIKEANSLTEQLVSATVVTQNIVDHLVKAAEDNKRGKES